jgi:ubiquinone/menaquinone biosynthesis C-methylase UbiE
MQTMKTQKDIKQLVKEKYDGIAARSTLAGSSGGCCSPEAGCCGEGISMVGEPYEDLEGYLKEADLALGCGIPTEYAGILPGHHVLDLGSGAGNDCFVARTLVGASGRVAGLDFSPIMLAKARNNAKKMGYGNVFFVEGDIEAMPFPRNAFDVVLSNCVINLVPDKARAFAEIFRVLKPGGHFCISDVVQQGAFPEALRQDAALYAGCVGGATEKEGYLQLIEDTGFIHATVHKIRKIEVPEGILEKHLDKNRVQAFQQADAGIFSITISGYKPL